MLDVDESCSGRSRRSAHVAVATVALAASALLVSACTEKKSRLEVLSDELEAKETKALEAAQASLPSLPVGSDAPPGLPSQLWVDLHWLPTSVVGVNGTAPGRPIGLADWAFSQLFTDDEACRALERGLARGYGIEWEQPPQSFVFFGTADLAQIEQCAEQFTTALGGSVQWVDGALRFELHGTETSIHFARRGEELVAILDDGRMGPVRDARADRLEGNARLTARLREVNVSAPAWSATSRDMTQVALGIPSSGYTMYVGDAEMVMNLRFAFANASEAKRAFDAAGPFVKETEATLGVSLHVKLALDADALAVSFDLTEFASLDPTKLEELQKKLDAFAAERQLQVP